MTAADAFLARIGLRIPARHPDYYEFLQRERQTAASFPPRNNKGFGIVAALWVSKNSNNFKARNSR